MKSFTQRTIFKPCQALHAYDLANLPQIFVANTRQLNYQNSLQRCVWSPQKAFMDGNNRFHLGKVIWGTPPLSVETTSNSSPILSNGALCFRSRLSLHPSTGSVPPCKTMNHTIQSEFDVRVHSCSRRQKWEYDRREWKGFDDIRRDFESYGSTE